MAREKIARRLVSLGVERIQYGRTKRSEWRPTRQLNEGLASCAGKTRRKVSFVLIVFILFNLKLSWLFALNETSEIGTPKERLDYAPNEANEHQASEPKADIIRTDNSKVQNQNNSSRAMAPPAPPVAWDQDKSSEEITTIGQTVARGVGGGGGNYQDRDSVISSSEIATNPMGGGEGGEAHKAAATEGAGEPCQDHEQTSNKLLARPETAPQQLSGDINTTRATQGLNATELEHQRRRFELEDKIPFTEASANDDQTSGRAELETVSQRTSRLLLQLLVLGFFILLSSSLIVVYSIKFCVCQRRKERRLLRRALIGDISSPRGLPSASAADPFHQTHLLALRNSNHLETNNGSNHLLQTMPLSNPDDQQQHLIECSCLQWRRLPAVPSNHNHHHHHLQDDTYSQLELGAGGLHQARLGNDSTQALQSEAIMSAQPQLVLAMLNRLQQLLAGEPVPRAAHSPVSASQQLSQLIVAQLQAQLSQQVPVPFAMQPGCACQHLGRQHAMLASMNARPPAYSELFLISSNGGVSAEQQPQPTTATTTATTERRPVADAEAEDGAQQRQTPSQTGVSVDEDDAETAASSSVEEMTSQ